MLKKEIRKIYTEKRKQLSPEVISELSVQMLQQLRAIDLSGIRCLLSYYPMKDKNEFDVSVCEQLLALDNSDLQMAWPRLQADGLTMEAIAVTKDTVLEKNQYGIFEPVGDAFVGPQLIDAVFVPLVGFDTRGFRVGYGKGYYDRYLSRCAQDTVKIGFSFFEAVERIEDVDEFDVPLNYCITPMRVYEF